MRVLGTDSVHGEELLGAGWTAFVKKALLMR